MKRTIKLTIQTLLGAVALFGASCIRDEAPFSDALPEAGREVTVELRLQTVDGSFGATRSEATPDEQKVENAVVLFFRGSDDAAKLYAVSEGSNLTPATAGTGVSFQASFVVETTVADEAFTCVVAANVLGRTLGADVNGAGTELSVDLLRSGIGAMTYADLQAALWEEVSGPVQPAGEAFPMYGRLTQPFIPSQSAARRFDVALLRDVARVRLLNAATADFTLTDVYIYRASDRRALLPEASAIGSDLSSLPVAQTPSLPAGTQPLSIESAWRHSITDNASEWGIYLPEADTHLAAEGAAPGDANHQNRCAVVVGGTYKGGASKSYYRIDFTTTSGSEGRALIDVLRNHSYNITITAVRSSGEATPDDAYKAQTADIDASIIEWTDENQEIVFDGTNWASVDRKRIDFADGEGVEALLHVLSNLAPSQWTMSLTVTEGDPLQETETAAVSGDATITGRYFSVTKPADGAADAAEQGGDVVIRTLQANTTSTTTAEGQIVPGVNYQETLHIYIGRLEILVELVQHPNEDTPWEDGDEFEGVF